MCRKTNRQALLNCRGVSGSTGACLPRLLLANNRMVASPASHHTNRLNTSLTQGGSRNWRWGGSEMPPLAASLG
jgi:hypothetical protein